MAEQEEQEAKVAAKQNEIKNSINPHVMEIKNISDSLISLMGKENFTQEDLENAFEKTDAIEEKTQEIIEPLAKVFIKPLCLPLLLGLH